MQKNQNKNSSSNASRYRAKSKKELAKEYGVHADTIKVWCEKIGIKKKGILFPKEVRKVYKHYGKPF